MTNFNLYLSDCAKKPSPTGTWLHGGPKISFDDMNKGRGAVERISATEAMSPSEGRPPKEEYRNWHPIEKSPPKKGVSVPRDRTVDDGTPLMNFGKHKDKTMKWVKENDANYWEWCGENIPWFPAKVEKAGLS